MGKHLSIRREPGTPSITAAEFAAACASHAELRFDASVENAGYYRNGILEATLSYQDGEIWTKIYEPEVVKLMISLASSLGAKAYGDEDEWYSEDGQAHYPPGVLEERLATVQKVKRRRLFISIAKMAILVAVITIIVINEMKK